MQGKSGAHGEEVSAGVTVTLGLMWTNGEDGAGSSYKDKFTWVTVVSETLGKGAGTLWWQKLFLYLMDTSHTTLNALIHFHGKMQAMANP